MAPNRLAKESSAYLKQHQDNPVDWYPWGPEALEKARSENKPIFLSIGYSACHWCHVMEHESFQDPKIAEILNQNFVSIKVDREERPDLDQIYQNVAQAMTQSGGWPLTVFLTPDLKPFYGGTYFPPEDRYGRPGLGRLLLSLIDAYKNKLEDIKWNSKRLMDVIIALESIPGSDLAVGADKTGPAFEKIFHTCQELLSHVDLEKGGIEGAPKFPNAMVFSLLWRMGLAKNWQPALDAVVLTLRKMAEGGVYDHLRGGFHRYSVDSNWLIPHFEKMLYDNGVLLRLYAEVLLTADDSILSESDRELFLNVLSQTVQFLKSEMVSKEGGFYSSQDADSEGHEGKYFVWTYVELKENLNATDFDIFKNRFGVTEKGNFDHGTNVLHIAASVSDISELLKIDEAKIKTSINNSIEKLLKIRTKRIAPGKDEKIIVSWNALMMSGLLWASQTLEKFGKKSVALQAREMAECAYQFITKNLVQKGVKDFGPRLWSIYQEGRSKINAYLDDYAFMSMAALDMARFSPMPLEYVDHAESWIHVIFRHFRDANGPGYFFTSDDHEQLIHRPKTIFDQSIPSGTGVTLNCLAALSEMGSVTGEGAIYEKELYSQLGALFTAMIKSPYACGELLCSALMAVMGPIAVSGKSAEMLCFHPHVFHKSTEDPKQEGLIICHRKTCEIPAESFKEAESSILRKVRRSVE